MSAVRGNHGMRFHFFSILATVVFACSSEARAPFESGKAPPESSQDETDPTRDGGAPRKDASPSDAGTEPEEEEDDLDLPTNDAGCLAWAAAEQVCGVKSDETVCELAVSCGVSADLGTCKINCEMQTTVNCYSTADAKCLLDAAKASSCTKLVACKWKL